MQHSTNHNRRLLPKTLARLALVGLAAGAAGCTTGSGHLETRTFALANFDSIETDNTLELEVTRADEFAVSVTTDDNLWNVLTVSMDGRRLHLGLQRGIVFTGVTVRANVSMPTLTALSVAGDGHARMVGFEATQPRITLGASGSSSIAGGVSAQDVTLGLSGASHADLTGTAAMIAIDASGASVADLGGLRASGALVSLSGSSVGTLAVESTLDYHLSGLSRLVYSGNPRIGTNDTSGGSTVEQR